MKKSILMGLSVLLTTGLLVSCHDEFGSSVAKGKGRIEPLVDLNTEVVKSRSTSPSSRADENTAKTITVEDLSLRLTKEDGSNTWNWEKIADFPTDEAFAVGNYTLEAYYGDPEVQGFDSPAYLGSQKITIKDGEITRPSITATLANAMLTLKFTDAFKGYMAKWEADINGVQYVQDEERPVYITPGEAAIRLSVTKPNGIGATFSLDPVMAEARHHYTVTVSVNDDNVGNAVLTVEFDDDMVTEDIEIDLSDKLLTTPAPTVTPKGFQNGQPIEIVAGQAPAMDLAVNVVALAGIKEVIMTTSSASLIAQGWPESIDLLAADPAMQNKLTAMGLKVVGLWKTPGEMAVIDLSGVVENITSIEGDDNVNAISVNVKDKLMREAEEPALLSIALEDVAMELSATGDYYIPDNTLQVKLSYNGSDVAGKVKFQYLDTAWGSVWRDMKIVDVQPVSRAMADYIVTLQTPNLTSDLSIRATCAGSVSPTIVIPVVVPEIQPVINENNVFASNLIIDAKETEGIDLGNAANWKVMVKAPGESAFKSYASTTVDGLAKISGLKPGTEYEVKLVIYGTESNVGTFTTEPVVALPNGDMENWTSTTKGSGNTACTVWACEGWSTLNELTTSAQRSACVYSALSSTLPEDGANGKAALIRSVGFDVKSTSLLGGNNFQQSACGELFLGSYNNAPEYGVDFSSRPQALSFSYKYLPTNSEDKGYAEITVIDSEGKTIATQNVALDMASEFTTKTITLNYGANAAKAAKLSVIFKSSNAGEAYLNTKDLPKHTGGLLGTTLNDYYVGAKLYVDDIELIY